MSFSIINMVINGVPYIDHRAYQLEKQSWFCRKCDTKITDKEQQLSDEYLAGSGICAIPFKKVTYILYETFKHGYVTLHVCK